MQQQIDLKLEDVPGIECLKEEYELENISEFYLKEIALNFDEIQNLINELDSPECMR